MLSHIVRLLHVSFVTTLLFYSTVLLAAESCPAPEKFQVEMDPAISLTGITVASSSGVAVNLSDQPDHVQLINFWASWCAPCRKELPLLEQVSQQLNSQGSSARIMAVNLGDTPEVVDEVFVAISVTDLPVFYFDSYSVLSQLKFAGLPATVVLTPQGTLYRYIGVIHEDSSVLAGWLRCLETNS